MHSGTKFVLRHCDGIAGKHWFKVDDMASGKIRIGKALDVCEYIVNGMVKAPSDSFEDLQSLVAKMVQLFGNTIDISLDKIKESPEERSKFINALMGKINLMVPAKDDDELATKHNELVATLALLGQRLANIRKVDKVGEHIVDAMLETRSNDKKSEKDKKKELCSFDDLYHTVSKMGKLDQTLVGSLNTIETLVSEEKSAPKEDKANLAVAIKEAKSKLASSIKEAINYTHLNANEHAALNEQIKFVHKTDFDTLMRPFNIYVAKTRDQYLIADQLAAIIFSEIAEKRENGILRDALPVSFNGTNGRFTLYKYNPESKLYYLNTKMKLEENKSALPESELHKSYLKYIDVCMETAILANESMITKETKAKLLETSYKAQLQSRLAEVKRLGFDLPHSSLAYLPN